MNLSACFRPNHICAEQREAHHQRLKTKPPSAKTNGGFLLPAILSDKMLQ